MTSVPAIMSCSACFFVGARKEATMTDETTSRGEALAHDAAPGLGRGGRMSRQRKLAAVLRLLQGEEDLELRRDRDRQRRPERGRDDL